MEIRIYVFIGVLWVLLPSYSTLILPSVYYSGDNGFTFSPLVVLVSLLFL
ncbi:hypothetical protein MNBD_GAMMA09-3858 [hydrothermal vent metagenome]|uniref:Uncharacterized protein n=1 Tax=hydrothermal vent metagenome TaxID=652676 RepID=A0A3B0X059_9ZZZZ